MIRSSGKLAVASRWPEGVSSGAVAIACSSRGFWRRARIAELSAASARVRFDDAAAASVATWLPRLEGFASDEETVTPERMAALPETARARP